MQSPDLKNALPSNDELPCSDDTPVDNEDQNFLPNVLLFLLHSIWANRTDWFFAVDMALYHTTGVNPRVPVVPTDLCLHGETHSSKLTRTKRKTNQR